MNKKEIAEIRKQLTKEHSTIVRICGCYVDGEGEQKTTFREAFPSLSEEDQFKYFDIFKKCLSGSIGKILFNLDIPLAVEQEEDGFHAQLIALRESSLSEDGLLENFYRKIQQHLMIEGNYLILLMYAAYDIPGKDSGGDEMFDASEEVYSHMICAICPVKLAKPGLSYNASKDVFQSRTLDWIVDPPAVGFLFPAFNDRSTDIHSALLYVKNAKQSQDDLVETLFGCPVPVPADIQKEAFISMIEDGLDKNRNFDTICDIQEQLYEIYKEGKDSSEPPAISGSDIQSLLIEKGAEESAVSSLKESYTEALGSDAPIMISNLVGDGKMKIETDDIDIKVDIDRAGLIETKTIDGRPFLMIPMDGYVAVNGIKVSSK